MIDETWAAHQTAFKLAQEAQGAGLVVTRLLPIQCGHAGQTEFNISLWRADGTLWAEGNHESREQVRDHIARYNGELAQALLG